MSEEIRYFISYFCGYLQQLIEHNILILLSDYEGTPGAVMDGMACGLVPVCTDISGGVQELVIPDQTGLLVRDRGD
jgi:glycosyltransferase involved in cell wall biosynthesis